MGQATHEQADLLLKLYDMRREARLRTARAWFIANYTASSAEEMMTKYPPGSEENTNIRMVVSYWDMVASMVNRGLIDDEFFFENTGELWAVWDRLRPAVPVWRTAFKNPYIFANLEAVATRMEAWREKKAPGTTEAMRQMLQMMQTTTAKAAG